MKHYILFTGHMIDAADRKEPRFPTYKEDAVKEEIYKRLLQQKEKIKLPLQGIASGACGGDIIFHEQCMKLDINSEIYLAATADEFKKGSVSFAGKDWDRRFNLLIQQLPYCILPGNEGDAKAMNIYERTNEWMLKNALKNGGKNTTLIALWNGGGSDGKGGTEHMVNIAKEQGADVEIIDIKQV